jgi:hypothetical protein
MSKAFNRGANENSVRGSGETSRRGVRNRAGYRGGNQNEGSSSNEYAYRGRGRGVNGRGNFSGNQRSNGKGANRGKSDKSESNYYSERERFHSSNYVSKDSKIKNQDGNY